MAYQIVTPVKLGQAVTTAGITTLYGPIAASTRTYVKDIDICNTSSTASDRVTVYLVPSGGTAGTSNVLVPGVPIPPNGMFQWSGSQILNTGDKIQITSTNATCTINASGGEAV